MKRITALFLCLFLSASVSSNEDRSNELAGHYYLQGAMEIGSELLLRSDRSVGAINGSPTRNLENRTASTR